uniref:Uncharacterized protein n=1 Tax=Helianthus annuus TaxID=4232 RepID=A0A251TEF5_HELAN
MMGFCCSPSETGRDDCRRQKRLRQSDTGQERREPSRFQLQLPSLGSLIFSHQKLPVSEEPLLLQLCKGHFGSGSHLW